jgi:hypothetical protein
LTRNSAHGRRTVRAVCAHRLGESNAGIYTCGLKEQ